MEKYWIKGEDGEDYGPSEEAEIRQWIEENRIGRGSLVRRDTAGEGWKPCESFPQFAEYMVEHEGQEMGLGPGQLPLAGFVARALAFVWDSILIWILVLFVFELTNLFLPASRGINLEAVMKALLDETAPLPAFVWVVSLITLGIQVSYNTYFVGKYGQTPGKKLFAVRVVDSRGLTPGYGRAFLRAIMSLVSQLPYVGQIPVFLGYLFFFVTPLRRTFHDVAAGTIVVQEIRAKQN